MHNYAAAGHPYLPGHVVSPLCGSPDLWAAGGRSEIYTTSDPAVFRCILPDIFAWGGLKSPWWYSSSGGRERKR